MSLAFHPRPKEIGQAVLSQIVTNLGSTLSLQVYQKGGMRRLPSPSDLRTYLNLLMVRYVGDRNPEIGPMTQAVRMRHLFDVWLLIDQAEPTSLNDSGWVNPDDQ